MTKSRFEEKMKSKGWNEIQMSERYNAKSGKLAKLLLIFLVLYFSVPLAIVYFKRDRYYIHHLVFSTEIMNFIILAVFLIIPWLLKLVYLIAQQFFGAEIVFDPNGTAAVLVLVIGLPVYFSIASRQVYRTKWWLAIVKSLALFLGLFYCLVLYRFTLFNATMALL